jgi:hypothetical protein
MYRCFLITRPAFFNFGPVEFPPVKYTQNNRWLKPGQPGYCPMSSGQASTPEVRNSSRMSDDCCGVLCAFGTHAFFSIIMHLLRNVQLSRIALFSWRRFAPPQKITLPPRRQ